MKSELTSLPNAQNYKQINFRCLENLKTAQKTNYSAKIKKMFKKRVQIRNLGT